MSNISYQISVEGLVEAEKEILVVKICLPRKGERTYMLRIKSKIAVSVDLKK